jgi:hypothetical protein
MKFKAVWRTDGGSANSVSSAISSVVREIPSGDRAAMRVTPSRFHFSSFSNRKDFAQSWAVIETTTAFSSVLCESLRGNEIDMAIPPKALLMVLKYVSQSVLCSMRLTKRETEPMLRFEFSFLDSPHSSLVVHDIPVEILKAELAWIEPQGIPEPDVKLIMKYPTRRIVGVMEKWKHAGINETRISAACNHSQNNCKVVLVGENNSTSVTLAIPNQSIVVEGRTPIADVSVTVSSPGLAFLLGHVLTPNADPALSMITLTHNRMVAIWIQLPNGAGIVRAYCPAILCPRI